MANSKEIKIRAVLDAQAFDKSVDQIQSRLKKLQQQSTQMQQSQQVLGKDPVMGRYAQQAFGDFRKEGSQELERTYRAQRQEAVTQKISMREKQQELEKLKGIDQELTKQQKERVNFLEKEISLLREKQRVTINQAAQTKRVMGEFTEEPGEVGAAGMGPQGPGMNLAAMGNYRRYRKMGFGRGTSRMLGGIGGPAAVAGSLTAIAPLIVRGISSGLDEYFEKERNIATAQGAATEQGLRPLRAQAQGRGIENLIFAPERARAYDTMQREMETRRGRDVLRGFSVGGALAGGAAGAVGGSAFFGIGAVPGMIGGALAGGFGTPMATDKGFRGAVFNTEEYRAGLNREAIQRQRQLEDVYKTLNFRKQMGTEFFEQNRGMLNQFQRRFGTQDAFRPEGFLGQMLEQGLPAQQAMNVAGGMAQAGGITPGAEDVGSIRRAFMMQQGGFTNAERVTGAIRGLARGGFGEEATDESMKKLFAEAVQAGVDDSRMVEEMRVFVDASVKMAQQTGMRVEEAATEVAKGMVGGPSAPGFQAAQNAFQMRNRMATSRGAGLQFKMAFGQTERGRQLMGGMEGIDEQLAFMNMDLENISMDNPMVRDMMRQMGVEDIEEFRRRKQEFDIAGGIRRGPTREKFTDFTKRLADMSPEERSEFLMSEKGAKRYTEIASELETQGLGGRFRDMMSFFSGVGETLSPEDRIREKEMEKVRQRAKEEGVGAGVLSQEFLEGEGAGTRLMKGFRERGEEQLTTERMGTEAADMRQMMKLFTEPTGEGEDSPAQIMRRASENYDASAQTFKSAVEVFKTAIEQNKAPDQALEVMRDVATAIARFSENPSADNRAAMEQALEQGREELNQPTTKTRTGGSYSYKGGFGF